MPASNELLVVKRKNREANNRPLESVDDKRVVIETVGDKRKKEI